MNLPPTKDDVLEAIRRCTAVLNRPPSKNEFKAHTGITEYQYLEHFPSWREAQRAAGVQPHMGNVKLKDEEILADWGHLVGKHRQIPTRQQYRKEGKFSPSGVEKHFGPWSSLPSRFREYVHDKPEWSDVLTLLPQPHVELRSSNPGVSANGADSELIVIGKVRHAKLANRPTYGNPIDFRGLRHEPVNEQGVVFLFGMVAKELGYMVEAVQTGYPDCEAKRQVGPNNWQRVRIEFEFESRNFRDHGHSCDGCDIIVCWRHNWQECPPNLEIVELSSIISTLSSSDD